MLTEKPLKIPLREAQGLDPRIVSARILFHFMLDFLMKLTGSVVVQ
jgi:hypothetical protein